MDEEDEVQFFSTRKSSTKTPKAKAEKQRQLAVQISAGAEPSAKRRKVDAKTEGAANKADKQNDGSDQEAADATAVSEAALRSGGEASASAPEITTFKALGLNDWLCGVCQSLGMARPTQVQQGCVPAILSGRDVIGLAQTGSGKTAAFALPILQKLASDPYGVFATVLTPTRCGICSSRHPCRACDRLSV